MAALFLIFVVSCKIKKAKSKKTGISAGYVEKLAPKLPLINKIKLVCMPQPGQSTCVTALNIQGS